MAVRVRQVTRTTQPQEAVGIDWNNPLTSGLVFAYLPCATADAARGLQGDFGGSGGALTPTPNGLSRAFNQDRTIIFPRDSVLEPTSVTVLAFVRSVYAQGSYARPFAKTYSNGGASPYDSFGFEYNSGGGDPTSARFVVSTGGSYTYVTVGVDTTNPQKIGLSYEPGGSGLKAYRDGVLVTTDTGITGSITYDASGTGDLIVGGYSDSASGNWVGDVYCAFVWNRRLSDAEVAQWSANPWQLFEPEKIVVKAAASASTTTVTVDAGSLTLTGQAVTNTVTAAVGAGTVTLTGQNVALQQQQPVTAGSTSLTGQSIGITITVPISPGTLSLTGSDVTVVPPSGSSTVTVDPGTLSLTGQAVTTLVTTPISEGSASLTGQDISVTTRVTVDPGSITLTGQVITVSYLGTQTIPVEPGTLSVTGRDVTVSVTGGTKGGAGKGKNLTLKQKKKLKAVVNQEWLKAEQTVQELLAERLTHKEPAKVRVEKLTQSQSLLDVIEALKALSKETVTLPEQQAVIKTINKTITEKTVKQVDRTTEIEKRMEVFEKRLVDLEEMVLVTLSEIL